MKYSMVKKTRNLEAGETGVSIVGEVGEGVLLAITSELIEKIETEAKLAFKDRLIMINLTVEIKQSALVVPMLKPEPEEGSGDVS